MYIEHVSTVVVTLFMLGFAAGVFVTGAWVLFIRIQVDKALRRNLPNPMSIEFDGVEISGIETDFERALKQPGLPDPNITPRTAKGNYPKRGDR